VSLAENTGAKLQISHLSANVYGDDNIKKAAHRIAASPADITCDVYPYNVWATSAQSAVFDDGFKNFNFDVTDLEILTGDYAGQYCTASLFEQLRMSQHDVMVACHNAMPIKDVEDAYRLPFVMVGSDGQMEKTPAGIVLGHPRGAGSPAKFLREFVREKRLFPLQEGIKKLTLLPADRCGFSSKGRLQVGCDADIVLFNYDTVAERAAFGPDLCAAPPDGIACVIVDGDIRYTPSA
jgi:N-acyl-D-amino-acid deacylase